MTGRAVTPSWLLPELCTEALSCGISHHGPSDDHAASPPLRGEGSGCCLGQALSVLSCHCSRGGGEAVPSQKEIAFLCTAEKALHDLLKGWPAPSRGHTWPECAGCRPIQWLAAGKGVASECRHRRLDSESVGYFCLQVFKKIKLSCETVLKLSKFK